MTTLIDQFKNLDHNIIVKFADNPYGSNGQLAPGWAKPSYDDFMVSMTENSSILDNSAIIQMNSKQHALTELLQPVEMWNQRNSSGVTGTLFNELASAELSPEIKEKILDAGAFVAWAKITENFILENVEGKDFLTHYSQILGEKAGPAFERIGIYGDKASTTTGIADGYKSIDGILKQLDNIKTAYAGAAGKPKGMGTSIDQTNILESLQQLVLEYVEQDGNMNDAVLYVPNTVLARLRIAISKRETSQGDTFIVDPATKEVTILGVKVVYNSNLDSPRNGFNQSVILTQKNNIIFGLLRNIESKMEYQLNLLGYLTAILCNGDVKVGFDKDTLGAEVTPLNATPEPPVVPPEPPVVPPETREVSVTVKDADEVAINGATVTLTNKTDGTKSYNCTTGSAGGCTLSSVPDGTYTVTATATSYQNYAGATDFTVSASSTSLAITMTASSP